MQHVSNPCDNSSDAAFICLLLLSISVMVPDPWPYTLSPLPLTFDSKSLCSFSYSCTNPTFEWHKLRVFGSRLFTLCHAKPRHQGVTPMHAIHAGRHASLRHSRRRHASLRHSRQIYAIHAGRHAIILGRTGALALLLLEVDVIFRYVSGKIIIYYIHTSIRGWCLRSWWTRNATQSTAILCSSIFCSDDFPWRNFDDKILKLERRSWYASCLFWIRSNTR